MKTWPFLPVLSPQSFSPLWLPVPVSAPHSSPEHEGPPLTFFLGAPISSSSSSSPTPWKVTFRFGMAAQRVFPKQQRERCRLGDPARGHSPREGPQRSTARCAQIQAVGEAAQNRGRKGSWRPRGPGTRDGIQESCWSRVREAGTRRGSHPHPHPRRAGTGFLP